MWLATHRFPFLPSTSLCQIGGFTNDELAAIFDEWNSGDLESFLIEITAKVLRKKDDLGDGFLVDKILDKTGMKGAGSSAVGLAGRLVWRGRCDGAACSVLVYHCQVLVGGLSRKPLSGQWRRARCLLPWTSVTCRG